MRGDVDGGDHAAVAAADGRGDGAQALLELLVDERPALGADAVELGAQGVGGRRSRGS